MSEEGKPAKSKQELRLEEFEKAIPKMTHAQLCGKLKSIQRQYRTRVITDNFLTPRFTPAQESLEATIFLTVLQSTKTRENPFGKLSAYPR